MSGKGSRTNFLGGRSSIHAEVEVTPCVLGAHSARLDNVIMLDPPLETVSPQINLHSGRLHVITYPAMLDVSRDTGGVCGQAAGRRAPRPRHPGRDQGAPGNPRRP